MRAYAAMLPILQAEERLIRITDIGTGTMAFDRNTRREIVNGLKKNGRMEEPRPRKASAPVLGAIGVGVRLVSGPPERVQSDG